MNKNITATILIILAAGLYFTVTKGMLDTAKQIQTVNTQYDSAITNSDQLVKVREQVLKNLNNLSQADREKLNKILPNTVDNIRLVIDLNGIAMKHGFTLKNIRAAASSNGSTPKANASQSASASQSSPVIVNNINKTVSIATPVLDTVTVSFGVTTTYQEFMSFMRDLEADMRIMDLTHLTMSASDTDTYNYSVEFKTYWMRTQ